MPNLKFHKIKSFKRTGQTFEDLHKWMDEGYEYLGANHRDERHSCAYIDYVKTKCGVEGVIEFLNHIIDDYNDTLSKFTSKCVVCGEPSFNKEMCLKCYHEFN